MFLAPAWQCPVVPSYQFVSLLSSICPDLMQLTCPCPCNLTLSAESKYIFFAKTIPPSPDRALPTCALTPEVKNSLFQHLKQVCDLKPGRQHQGGSKEAAGHRHFLVEKVISAPFCFLLFPERAQTDRWQRGRQITRGLRSGFV